MKDHVLVLVVAVLALLGLDTVRAFYFSQNEQGQMNQGQMGQGQFGQNQNGQGQFGQDQNGQGQFGQDQNGQGQFGQDQNGQGQFGQDQNGQGQGGQGWIDQGQFGQDQNGQGQGGRGQGQFVQDQDSQGQGRTGQGYFGQDQNGQGQRGQGGTDRGQSGPNQNQNYQNFFNQYQNREVVDLGQIGQTVNLDQISQQLSGQGLDLGQLTQSLNGQNGNIQNGRYVNTQIVRGELTQIPGTNAFAIIVNNPGMNVMIQNMAITAVTTIQKWDMMFFLAGVDTMESSSTTAMKAMFTPSKEKAVQIGKEGRVKNVLMNQLIDVLNVTKIAMASVMDSLLGQLGVAVKGLETDDDNCDQFINIDCDSSSPYRTMDGSCNNLRKPLWGRAFIPFRRFLEPAYDDGVSSPRQTAESGNPLASAREVSFTVHESDEKIGVQNAASHLLMQWGQFLDHDITSTPIQSGVDGSHVRCCTEDLSEESRAKINMNPEDRDICFPITIPENDPMFKARTCMSFVRSIQVSNTECKLAPAEQLNQITAYIDGSMIYGSSLAEMRILRAFDRGLLKTSPNDLLPEDTEPSCRKTSEKDYCFKAGDTRVNEQMALATLHTIWVREHNRMAKELSSINPSWDDERLFQETRKIVGAKIQHITYKEFLRKILNGPVLNQFDINPKLVGFQDKYNPNVDASIRNAFATSAYRFGHTLVRTMFSKMNQRYQGHEDMMLSRSFGNTSQIIEDNGDGVNKIVRGLVTDNLNKFDRYMSPQLTQHLFEDGVGHKLDLAALNIQRGRDHGLPSYNQWRRWCQLPVAGSFSSGRGGLVDLPEDAIDKLRSVYEHPDDIDLFAGGMSENPIRGGIVGPTFSCILSHQFKALRVGDRFFYDRDDKTTGFTKDQVNAIKVTTIAKVLCDNTDIESIQPDAFFVVRNKNQRVSCDQLTQAPLVAWAEDPVVRRQGSQVWRISDKLAVTKTSDNFDCSKSIYRLFSKYLCEK
ncbi:peroxidase mlt-7-like isoform X1 [Haliotis rufescens]|uniref:peroxidase mlt-7-like isoform X1 n=1 Tax=Haliotis rufescens TaxID=6454 RepID=UPI00201ED579|nr:peroxidase mlt-7-like isoform X1 [Haliotis rufescens]